jgi:hypothetical protein
MEFLIDELHRAKKYKKDNCIKKFLCFDKLFMEVFFISAKFGKNFLWKYDNFFVEVRQNFCGKTLFSI